MIHRKTSKVSAQLVHVLIVLTISTIVVAYMPDGRKTMFRYRAFSGSRPSWVSPIDPVGGIDHSSSSDINSIDRGFGFNDMLSADFDGSSEYIRATDLHNTNDNGGDDSFTVQAWFLADAVSGYRTLICNTQSYKGFSLKIKDGQLRSLIRIANGGSYVNHELIGGTIEAGKWYHVALRVKENSSNYDVRHFINGSQVAQNSVGDYDGIRQSDISLTIAAEADSGVPTIHFFDGRIHAVTVANYAMEVEHFLLNKTVRDGGTYFGIGSFHDYLNSTEGVDYRIDEEFYDYPDLNTYLTNRFYTPLMNDSYVPQGLATNGTDTIYVSMHWRNESGTTGSYPSVVTEFTPDGRLKRVMQLYLYNNNFPYAGSVGGMAYWNNKIYLTNYTSVILYQLPASGGNTFNPETFANPRHDNPIYMEAVLEPDIGSNTHISYMSTGVDDDGSPILWLGQYSKDDYEYIMGYSILWDGTINTTPLYTFKLPVTRVQGIYCHQSNSNNLKIYICRSYSDDVSRIYDIHYNKGNQYYQSIQTVFTGPAGMEGIAMIDSELWTVSESGAKYYQKRSDPDPWDEYFPFVFSLRFYHQGDINIDGSVDSEDLLLLCQQWLGMPGEQSADIAGTWGDGFVDFRDFVQLGLDWQKDLP